MNKEKNMEGCKNRIRVGYILKMFPRFSETFIMNEILELERRGVEVTVFSLIPPTDGKFHSRLAEIQAEVHYLPQRHTSEFWNDIRRARPWLRKRKRSFGHAMWHSIECTTDSGLKYFIRAGIIASWIRELDIDHLHAHFASSPAHVAMYASMLSGVPYSFTAHAKDIYQDKVDWRLFRDLVRQASFMVTVSRSNRDYIIQRVGSLYTPRIFHIYNGLDLGYFRMSRAPRAANRILAVGRLVEKKGFRYLIEAVRLLKDQGQGNLECDIVGEGPERAQLQSLIKRLKLSRAIRLLGPLPQDDVLKHMKQATVFVLPAVIAKDGNRDSLPTVLLEAMALGLPVISTDVVGIPEITDKGACGLLAGQASPSALAEAISALLRNRSLRTRLASAGRKKVEKDFDIKKNVQKFARLIARSRQLKIGYSKPKNEKTTKTRILRRKRRPR